MKEDRKKEKGEVSRRDFLIGGGAAVVGAAVGAGIAYPLAADGGGTETVTTTKVVSSTKTVEVPTTITSTAPGGTVTDTTTKTATVTKTVEVPVPGEAAASMVSFTVNGQNYKVAVEPNWTLQELLHDVLGFVDIKTFCYRGACGSCTVIMDGRPILSCMTLAANADGKTIETAQGIAQERHPLVDSYVNNECMQCGYCTPGFLATAKALLDRNPEPTDDEIIEALSGNLCRCGTYPAHLRAIHEAADVMKGGS